MKTRVLLTAALLVFVSCLKEVDSDNPKNNTFSIVAALESGQGASKSVVYEGGPHVYWEPGDEIGIYYKYQSGRFTTDITEPSAVATFTGTMDGDIIPEDSELWAMYPYSGDALFNSRNHSFETVIPNEQTARANSFGKGLNITVGHSTTQSFTFYNVGGGVRISFAKSGVTKAVLKSLGGESIAGRFGIDTSGETPTIQSVYTGYSSITLLPPDGVSFQKDTWYYFVTIPGTLSQGYEVYYCTDNDSGKLISDNSVTIKRSVYGSIEHVDSRAEQAGPTKPFPSTEEEWEASFELASSIAGNVHNVLYWNGFYSGNTNAKKLVPLIGAIDGVSKVYMADNQEIIVVEQQDGLHFSIPIEIAEKKPSFQSQRSQTNSLGSTPRNIVTPSSKKKALLIMPFYNDPFIRTSIKVDYHSISESLKSCGYELDAALDENTDPCWSAGIMSDYNLILLATHGNVHWPTVKGADDGKVGLLTRANQHIDWPDFYGLSFMETIKLYYWQGYVYDIYGARMYENCFNDVVFNNSIVIAMACHSYEAPDLANYFLTHGCSAYCGNTESVYISEMGPGIVHIVDYLSKGASLKTAINYAKNMSGDLPMIQSPETKGLVYLINPTPSDLDVRFNDAGDYVTLSWKMPENTGTYKYDVYWEDGTLIKEDVGTTDYSFYLDYPGEYNWYVESKLYDDDQTMIDEPHRSDISSFVADFSDFVDLGLSVKWARCNLGAAYSEMSGDRYLWGVLAPSTSVSLIDYPLWDGQKGS